MVPTHIEEVAPYRYCFVKNGIMENEVCPILVATVQDQPKINPDEVEAVRWTEWKEFLNEITRDPMRYSEWCIEQARILENTIRFHAFRDGFRGPIRTSHCALTRNRTA